MREICLLLKEHHKGNEKTELLDWKDERVQPTKKPKRHNWFCFDSILLCPHNDRRIHASLRSNQYTPMWEYIPPVTLFNGQLPSVEGVNEAVRNCLFCLFVCLSKNYSVVWRLGKC